MMDSDEDDIYPEHNDTDEQQQQQHQAEVKMEDVEDGEEEGEEVEDSDVCDPATNCHHPQQTLCTFTDLLLTSRTMSISS